MPVKKTRGGPGNRKEPRMRENDSGTEDSGEKVPGQKKARRLLKETGINEGAISANHAAVAVEQTKYPKAIIFWHAVSSGRCNPRTLPLSPSGTFGSPHNPFLSPLGNFLFPYP